MTPGRHPNRKNRGECQECFKNRTGGKEACREQRKHKEHPPVDLREKLSRSLKEQDAVTRSKHKDGGALTMGLQENFQILWRSLQVKSIKWNKTPHQRWKRKDLGPPEKPVLQLLGVMGRRQFLKKCFQEYPGTEGSSIPY